MIVTECSFTLPRGFVSLDGAVYRNGLMRLATAKDEIAVQRDRRIQESDAYSTLVMLSRVIIRLGELTVVTPELLENLFTIDFSYLQEFYNQINQHGTGLIPVQCPSCQNSFKTELVFAGE